MRLLSRFLPGALLGLALGLFAGVCVMQYFRQETFSGHSQDFIDNMVPALFAAMATLLASVFAICGVALNIRNQNHLAKEDRRLKLLSARASLSAALDDLGWICKLHISMILHKGKYDTDDSMEVSERTMNTMKQIIENSAYNVQENISDLLNFYQIAKQRYKDLHTTYTKNREQCDNSLTKYHEKEMIVLWASLRALTQCYYNYGRGDSFKVNRMDALKSFQNELTFLGQDGQVIMVSGNANDSPFSEYIDKEDCTGCGFLDPDFLKRGGIVKEDPSIV